MKFLKKQNIVLHKYDKLKKRIHSPCRLHKFGLMNLTDGLRYSIFLKQNMNTT